MSLVSFLHLVPRHVCLVNPELIATLTILLVFLAVLVTFLLETHRVAPSAFQAHSHWKAHLVAQNAKLEPIKSVPSANLALKEHFPIVQVIETLRTVKSALQERIVALLAAFAIHVLLVR